MSGSSIKANTGAIKTAADNILGYARTYSGAFSSLYEDINALKATWTSTDGDAYINKINSYREEFETMFKKLEASAEALQAMALNYENTIEKNTVS